MHLECFIGYFRVPSSVYVVLSKAQHTWTGARDEVDRPHRLGKAPTSCESSKISRHAVEKLLRLPI